MLTWFPLKESPRGLDRLDSRSVLDITHVLARTGVPGFRQALPQLTAELGRARRYQHALSVALFETDGFPLSSSEAADPVAAPGRGANGASAPHPPMPASAGHGLLPAVLASILRESTREADVVTYAAALGRCIVAMPETDGVHARRAVERLAALTARRLLCPVRVSVAAFPQDGLTLEELIRQAEEEGRHPCAASSRSDLAARSALGVESV